MSNRTSRLESHMNDDKSGNNAGNDLKDKVGTSQRVSLQNLNMSNINITPKTH
jgi:hypothetical protein